MNIHIDLIRRDRQKHEPHRIPARHEQPAIRLLHRVGDTAVAKPPAVHEQVLQLRVAAIAFRVRNEACRPSGTRAGIDFVQSVTNLAAEEQRNAIEQPRRTRDVVYELAVVPKRDVQRWVRQREPRDGLADVAEFSCDTLEELFADWDVKEEVAHFDPRPGAAIPWAHGREVAAITLDLGPKGLVMRPRLQRHLADPGHRRKCFAPEAHRADGKEIVGVLELARGMTREREG